ncbi:MAG: helix-turn-helix domain-containing protein [Candidatus Ratteibacteria bacterium]|jgi:excisionase family DNA binding protein
MNFWKRFAGEPKEEETETEEDVSVEPSSEESLNTLSLGWYWSENKNEHQMAKIDQKDRTTHFYVIGATGTGKTKFLEFLIQQDIEKGNGFGVIDPHGDLIEDIKGFLACRYDADKDEEEISERIILIDPTDPNFTVTFNPLEKLPNITIPEQVSEFICSFKKMWADSWGVRMEDLLRNSLIALGEAEYTLSELTLFLTDRVFRQTVLEKVIHTGAREYFKKFDSITDRGQVTWIEPITNKINAFFAEEKIRQMFSSPKSSFNMREAMDNRKVILIKLDKGRLKDTADILGSLLLAKIQMAAFSRSDISQSKRTPFYLYVDEFQNFAGDSFATVLSEARKYGLSLIMAHQTLAQIPLELRSLILGNTGIQVYFRVNRQDANLLAKEAFEYSGFEVKSVHGATPRHWSYAEEWERNIAQLQHLSPRICYAAHKLEGGIIPIQTADIESSCEILGMDEEEYQKHLKTLPFGKKYLISRKELAALSEQRQVLFREGFAKAKRELIEVKTSEKEVSVSKRPSPAEKTTQQTGPLPEERGFLEFVSKHPAMFVTKVYESLGLSGYKGDRLKQTLIEKGLIEQEETREGNKGRLAKVLTITDKGASVLKDTVLSGKGGEIHKQLQLMLKEQTELFGWKAVIEERIPKSLESVDVGLRKDDIRVAVEISHTSKSDYEITNIRKCLEAGYDYVVSVCSDDKFLVLFRTEVKKGFSFKERERIRFYQPSQVNGFLQSISPAIVSEKGIVSGQIPKQKLLLDTTETSEFLGIKKNTLYEWIVQKKIPHLKVGRLVKFRKTDLEAWLEKRSQEEKENLW